MEKPSGNNEKFAGYLAIAAAVAAASMAIFGGPEWCDNCAARKSATALQKAPTLPDAGIIQDATNTMATEIIPE